MKQFRRSMSLVLALVMLLSMVYIAPIAANAAPSDYIATSYAANLSVKTTKVVNLMTAPSTASGSSAKYTLPANTMLTVKALHKNTSNAYFYEVLYYNMTLYIDATATTLVDHLTGDVTIENVMSPASLAYGASFGIKGDITSTLNDLGTISANMYPNTNTTQASAMGASDTATGKSYSLAGSTIDYNLVFGAMDPGVYTYVVTAEAISYYIDSTGALATSAQTVVLNTQQCVITDWRNPNDDLAFGIDVSTWQGSIDWSQAKNDIDFAILRIGFSTTLDNRFLEYAENCEKYNIPYGVYHYSYALTVSEVVAEADFVINTLRSYGYEPDMAIWFDMEDGSQAALSTSMKEALASGFCDRIAEAGYQPGFYGFTSWFSSSFQSGYLSSVPVWIAQIDGFSSNGTATHDGGTWLWQYSWEGSISGISGDVDCNLCYAPFNNNFNSDTTYLSKCTQYPARAIATTTESVNLRQYPASSYTNLGSIAAGTTVEVTGLYKNASGEYWYQIVNGDDAGYIYADYLTISEFLYDDLAVIEPAMTSNLNVGSSYSIVGKMVSQWNTINTSYAKVYSGEDTLASPVLSSSYANNSKNYNLYRSEVDYSLPFNQLDAGYYTYEISADVKNYYVSNGALTSETENVVLWTAPFTVGSAAITPPANVTCDHNIVTDAAVAAGCTTTGLTEGSHCTKCGAVFTAQTVTPATGHSYKVTSDKANCQEYELFHYACSKCGDKYDISADELANWSETKPLGVPESAIESKTQYRYADCTSSTWEAYENKTLQYVNSWPSGFSTSSSLYSQYNKKSSKVTASETDTAKTVINSDQVVGYLYYHWCYTDSYYSLESSSGSYTTFHAYYDTTDPDNYTCDTSDMSYKTSHSTCSNSNWFFVAEVYGQNYTNYKKVKDGKEWGAWSAWGDTAYTAVENSRKVETRTVYRYTGAELGDHVWSDGVCSVCGETCNHNYVDGICSICGGKEVVAVKDYYLFGYINGADYACEGDYANLGEYKFVDGKLVATFTSDSYVGVKAGDNLNWYMTDGWQGTETTSATLYNTNVLGNADKLFVPGGVEVTFTLVVNDNDTLTLSYVAEQPEVVIPTITPKYPALSFEQEIVLDIFYTVTDLGNVGLNDMGLITFSSGVSNGNINNAEAVIPGATYDSTTGMYHVRSAGIPAKKLSDTIYFRVYAKLADGTYAYSDMMSYSPKTYANKILSGNYGTDMKALVVAMLNYGATAQTYFNYKPYNLMNAHLTADQKALVESYNASMVSPVIKATSTKAANFADNGGFSRKYPNISFEGAFAINYFLTPSYTVNGNITLYYWTAADYNSVSKLTTANATGKLTMTGTSEYQATVEGIAAKELDSTIYVAAVYTSNGTTYYSGVLAYSIGAYCIDRIANGSATMQPFAAATAVYGYYAKVYFSNK